MQGSPLILDNLPQLLQCVELPLDKGVVVGVHVRGDEGSPPVDATAHGLDVTNSQGRKVVKPVGWDTEVGDLRLRDVTLLEDLVLRGPLPLLGGRLALLPAELGRI